jgi:hypothetical protein
MYYFAMFRKFFESFENYSVAESSSSPSALPGVRSGSPVFEVPDSLGSM